MRHDISANNSDLVHKEFKVEVMHTVMSSMYFKFCINFAEILKVRGLFCFGFFVCVRL